MYIYTHIHGAHVGVGCLAQLAGVRLENNGGRVRQKELAPIASVCEAIGLEGLQNMNSLLFP